jgi:hypothetical protein
VPETSVAELSSEAQSPPEPRPTGQQLPEGETGRQEAAAQLQPPSSTGPEAAETEIGSRQEDAAAAPLQPPSSIGQELAEGDAGMQEAAAAPSRPSPRSTGQELPEGEAGRQEADSAPSKAPTFASQEIPEGKPGRPEAGATPSQPSTSTGPEPAEREIGGGQEAAAAAPSRPSPLTGTDSTSRDVGACGQDTAAAAPSRPSPRSTGQGLPEGEAGRQGPPAAPFLDRLLAPGRSWRRGREAAAAPSLLSRPTGQKPPEGEAGRQEADAAPSQPPPSCDQEPPAKTTGAGLPTKAQPPPETSEADELIARSRAPPRRRPLVLRMLITCVAVALAAGLGWAAWDAHMGAPWTRDGTVRVYVVTVAPEVAGRIVDLPVADNQFVHRGDLLVGIDPTDYMIAVSLAEAALANVKNSLIQAERRRMLTPMAAAEEEKQNFATSAEVAQAQYRQAMANLDQARVNLKRAEIRSAVNGWVTNLLAQRGDYATVGMNTISLVDADSFWVDCLFRRDEPGLNPRRRSGQRQADGL